MFTTHAHMLRLADRLPLDRLCLDRLPLDRLPLGSQQTARHNALVASTALAARRRELLEVEEYLTRLDEVPAQSRAAEDVTERLA